MGRPRKPTGLKILDGDQPCRINLDEPRPEGSIGDPPDYLDDEAREAWSAIGGPLERAGILTSADREGFGLYLATRSRWIKANEAIDAEGLTVGGQFGDKPNPHIAISNACASMMAKFHAHMGMTPASRAALKVGPKSKDDPLAAFFAARSKSSHAKPKKKA